MKNIVLLFVIIFSLTACSSKPILPVDLSQEFWTGESQNIGVVSTKQPEAFLSIVGADCLLCYAAAATANASLSKHAKTLSTAEFSDLKEKIVAGFTEQGIQATVIEDPIVINELAKFKSKTALNPAKRDFSSYSDQYTHVVVLDYGFAGLRRYYASYIPKGAPTAVVNIEAYMVDTATNELSSYQKIMIDLSAEGQWKEKPDYPSLTNAYYQATATALDNVLSQFSK